MSGPIIQLPPDSYARFAACYDEIRYDRFSLSLADRVESLISRIGAERILELACGTGSLLIRLASPGRFLAGIDLSPEMIAAAKVKEGALPLAVGSMTNLPIRGRFDLVFCFYDSMNYVMTEENLFAAFSEARRVLRKGGIFVFDMNNRSAYEKVWAGGDAYVVDAGRGRVTISSRYDAGTAVGTARLDIEAEEDGRKVTYRSTHRQKFHPGSRVKKLLADAGFENVTREGINPFPEEEFDLVAKDLWTAFAEGPDR